MQSFLIMLLQQLISIQLNVPSVLPIPNPEIHISSWNSTLPHKATGVVVTKAVSLFGINLSRRQEISKVIKIQILLNM